MKVIAEVGSNFKSLNDCLHSVREAKRAGADVVKFQHFDGADLYGPDYDGVRSLYVNLDKIANTARNVGIELMCTAFSPAGYDYVNPYVTTHKVASSEITAVDILDKVNSLKKPVYLSTGGASHDQIAEALLVLRNVPVTLMFCVVQYPAKIIDFRHMTKLRERFGKTCEIGYSDHSIDVLNIPLMAKDRGAVVIEKHVNFCDYTDTPDASTSINTYDLSLMVRNLKGALSLTETAIANPYQRKQVKGSFGKVGYWRPMPNAG